MIFNHPSCFNDRFVAARNEDDISGLKTCVVGGA